MFQDNGCLSQAGSGYFLFALGASDTQAVKLCRMLAA
jgi:hypothetical protein